jgi:hypothetical protein
MRWLRESALVLLLLAGAPAGAGAAEVDARAVTILGGRPDVRDGVIHTAIPIYELISLNARRIEDTPFDDFGVVVSLWGRLDPGDLGDGDRDRAEGDIDLGYLEGTAFDRTLRLRLGRQLVFAGGTRGEGLDGLMAETRAGLVGVTLFGGIPVTPRFGLDRGDALWGARASLRRSVDAEVGLSYVHALDDGRVRRFDLGIDGRYARRRFSVHALGLLSAEEMRLAEARVSAAYQASRAVHVFLEAARTAPDLFLSRASILSVFSDMRRDEAGAIVSLRAAPDVRARASYHALGNEEGLGHRAEVECDATVSRGVLVGAEAGLLTLTDDGYVHGRLFGRADVARRMALTLEGDLYRLEEEHNGTRFSSRAASTWRWDFAPSWRSVVSAMVGSDPFYEVRWEAMLKLAWSYDARVRR